MERIAIKNRLQEEREKLKQRKLKMREKGAFTTRPQRARRHRRVMTNMWADGVNENEPFSRKKCYEFEEHVVIFVQLEDNVLNLYFLSCCCTTQYKCNPNIFPKDKHGCFALQKMYRAAYYFIKKL